MKHETGFFNQHPDLYDVMIPWEQRLARELPFFEKIFSKYKIHSVVDCGCGTGWHTISFAKRGLHAIGLDNSMAMIQYARQNAVKQKSSTTFYQGDFQSVDKIIHSKVNAVVCLGNSLAILGNKTAVLKTLKSMSRVLTEKGIIVFQVLNFQRMSVNKITGLPPRLIQKDDKEYLFLRLFDITHKQAKINFVLLTKENKQWTHEVHSTALFYFTKPLLTDLLKKAGFSTIQIYGDMSFTTFSAKNSADLIVIARM